MTLEHLPQGKVLFVDDEEMIRDILGRQAKSAGLGPTDFEVLEDAAQAVTMIDELAEREEIIAAIITDGLNGGWELIFAAARKAQADPPISVIVVSGSDIASEVEGWSNLCVKAHPRELCRNYPGRSSTSRRC